MGPNELSWMDAALGMLAQAGLKPREQYYAFLAIIGHVRGHATFEQIRSEGRPAQKQTLELSRLLEAERSKYSTVRALMAAEALRDDRENSFEYGLNCILEGIAARLRKPRRRRGATN
jgi:hypothetical protein